MTRERRTERSGAPRWRWARWTSRFAARGLCPVSLSPFPRRGNAFCFGGLRALESSPSNDREEVDVPRKRLPRRERKGGEEKTEDEEHYVLCVTAGELIDGHPNLPCRAQSFLEPCSLGGAGGGTKKSSLLFGACQGEPSSEGAPLGSKEQCHPPGGSQMPRTLNNSLSPDHTFIYIVLFQAIGSS